MHTAENRELGELNEIKQSLFHGNWIFDDIFPDFRNELIEELFPSPEKAAKAKNIPICFLASGYYQNRTSTLRERVGGKSISISPVEIIDNEITEEHSFWENAVKELVGENAVLGTADQSGTQAIIESIHRICIALPALKSAFEFIPYVVVFRSSDWVAASQPHYAGSIFISEAILKKQSLAEIIVHEFAHQEMFCLNLIDRIVEESADYKYVYAPFQQRARPPIGRIHAAHSLFRASQFSIATGDQVEANKMVTYLEQTLATLNPEDFTEFGKFLIRECYFPLTKQK